jgi:hypothetical protein
VIPSVISQGPRAGSAGAIGLEWPDGMYVINDVYAVPIETANEAITVPSGWSEFVNSPQGIGSAASTTATRLTGIWKRAESTTESVFTIADTGSHQVGQGFLIRGCKTTGAPYHITAGDTFGAGGSSVCTVPGLTTTLDDCLVMVMGAYSTDAAVEQASDFHNASLADLTQWGNCFTASDNGGGVGIAFGSKRTAGAVSATTFTLASSATQARLIVAFESANPGVYDSDNQWVEPFVVSLHTVVPHMGYPMASMTRRAS